jgi:predicted kinase
MDLWARGLRCQANRFLERYCERTGDLQGLALLPLFLSMRAAIRAHVSVAMAATAAPDRRPILARSARLHLDHAQAHLRVTPPRLVAVGGLSGSGKSTIARAVAPWLGAAPGAAVLRSDVVRKRLAGIDPSERAPPGAYAPGSSARVYAALREQAATALAAGRAVIVDAVHARPEERAAVEAVATRLGVPFAGIWLDAPEATLVARVDARTADASDADGAVVRQQLGYALGEIGWHRIAAAPAPAEVAETVAAVLGLEDVSTFCIGGKGE